MEKNLTTGSGFRRIVAFSIPFLLSNFLQTLYGLADLFIVGLYCPSEATSAVTNGSQVMHMATVIIVGLAMGTTVIIGRAVGSGDRERASAAIGNSVTLFMAASVVISAVLLCLIDPIVSLMDIPVEAVSRAKDYLLVCFIGIPFIVAYNILGAIFRGLGDSKSPMYFIAVACAANIALDFLFVGLLSLDAFGAALATVLAQAISVIVSLFVVLRKKTGLRVSARDLVPKRNILGDLLRVGFPIAVQDGCIQISFIVIMIIANGGGLAVSSAVGIVEKIIGILFLIPSAMLSTVSALSAQNIGAGKLERARSTLRYGVLICAVFGALTVFVFQFAHEWAVDIFTNDASVILLGGQYLRSYAWDCLFAGIHFCFSGYFCALGRSGISFAHNLASILAVRIPVAYLASILSPDNLYPMGWASSLGSVLSVLICVFAYIIIRHSRRENKDIKGEII